MSGLAALREQFKNTTPITGGGDFEPLDDGEYIVVVEEASVTYQKDKETQKPNKDRPQVKYQFKVLDGDAKNRKLWRYDGLMNTEKQPDAFGYALGNMQSFGADMEAITDENFEEDIVEELASLAGTVHKVFLKSKNGFTNIYHREALVDESAADYA